MATRVSAGGWTSTGVRRPRLSAERRAVCLGRVIVRSPTGSGCGVAAGAWAAGGPCSSEQGSPPWRRRVRRARTARSSVPRSEEHTSELQSRLHLVCRLLLEKKKKKKKQ